MRVAIVHDALCVRGGAERVALWMARAFPAAPIFTSVYLADQTFPQYREMDVRVLPFARLIHTETQFKLLHPLWLFELQSVDFSQYDVVLSSSTYLAKYVRPREPVMHAAYIYAPFRLLWKPDAYGPGSLPARGVLEQVVRLVIPLLRRWDLARTKAIPRIATTCRNMAGEIMQRYGRSAAVIYPPVEIPHMPPQDVRDDFFLCVGRLAPHKRFDLAVEACSRLKKRLIVAGDGPERERLQRLAGPTVEFVGRVSDETLHTLYFKTRALIFPSYEDYGLVPLEAQARAAPVIAFGRGGVLETVKEGVSGIFFASQDVDSLVNCLREFEGLTFSAPHIRQWADKFEPQGFIRGLQDFVRSA
jgi:glycosyltransferase involved in cell wall biosynthesis